MRHAPYYSSSSSYFRGLLRESRRNQGLEHLDDDTIFVARALPVAFMWRALPLVVHTLQTPQGGVSFIIFG